MPGNYKSGRNSGSTRVKKKNKRSFASQLLYHLKPEFLSLIFCELIDNYR